MCQKNTGYVRQILHCATDFTQSLRISVQLCMPLPFAFVFTTEVSLSCLSHLSICWTGFKTLTRFHDRLQRAFQKLACVGSLWARPAPKSWHRRFGNPQCRHLCSNDACCLRCGAKLCCRPSNRRSGHGNMLCCYRWRQGSTAY